ncbi:Hypothetical protein RG1141_CH29480 [Neorhizobium galegae bv. officinalis bv. officinalis str. HAMBI 1141]|uniref:Uncharacterized protein n=1 Tax=Neorhizobium galegae bv. officinalis bv. officinalis str. HAMBI 1141 TaxID=1028801 RepID=A0A068TB00_NEOGA|nr:Hypothetical protein RG1141_CH29480 [Neorhizobium galegae bv. officinalis bv. officinalis str. HAMBI 1141]
MSLPSHLSPTPSPSAAPKPELCHAATRPCKNGADPGRGPGESTDRLGGNNSGKRRAGDKKDGPVPWRRRLFTFLPSVLSQNRYPLLGALDYRRAHTNAEPHSKIIIWLRIRVAFGVFSRLPASTGDHLASLRGFVFDFLSGNPATCTAQPNRTWLSGGGLIGKAPVARYSPMAFTSSTLPARYGSDESACPACPRTSRATLRRRKREDCRHGLEGRGKSRVKKFGGALKCRTWLSRPHGADIIDGFFRPKPAGLRWCSEERLTAICVESLYLICFPMVALVSISLEQNLAKN